MLLIAPRRLRKGLNVVVFVGPGRVHDSAKRLEAFGFFQPGNNAFRVAVVISCQDLWAA